jgi:hypothetical protein
MGLSRPLTIRLKINDTEIQTESPEADRLEGGI